MVYLHGGNFVHMSGGSLLYDGSIFTKRGNVILVNVDYRLGELVNANNGYRGDEHSCAQGIYTELA